MSARLPLPLRQPGWRRVRAAPRLALLLRAGDGAPRLPLAAAQPGPERGGHQLLGRVVQESRLVRPAGSPEQAVVAVAVLLPGDERGQPGDVGRALSGPLRAAPGLPPALRLQQLPHRVPVQRGHAPRARVQLVFLASDAGRRGDDIAALRAEVQVMRGQLPGPLLSDGVVRVEPAGRRPDERAGARDQPGPLQPLECPEAVARLAVLVNVENVRPRRAGRDAHVPVLVTAPPARDALRLGARVLEAVRPGQRHLLAGDQREHWPSRARVRLRGAQVPVLAAAHRRRPAPGAPWPQPLASAAIWATYSGRILVWYSACPASDAVLRRGWR